MSTFRVGQRVRIVCLSSPQNGREATVISSAEPTLFVDGRIADAYDVAIDGVGTGDNGDGITFAYEAHQLEPIQPERNKTIAWEECICGPDGKMREGLAA